GHPARSLVETREHLLELPIRAAVEEHLFRDCDGLIQVGSIDVELDPVNGVPAPATQDFRIRVIPECGELGRVALREGGLDALTAVMDAEEPARLRGPGPAPHDLV